MMNGDMCLVNWEQANLSFSDWCDNKITLIMNMGYSCRRGQQTLIPRKQKVCSTSCP